MFNCPLYRIAAVAIAIAAVQTSSLAQTPAQSQAVAPVSFGRYAVILQDEPAASRFATRADLASPAAVQYRQRIQTAQRAVRTQIESRGIRVNGAVDTLLNAIFVVMPASRAAEVAGFSGVKAVVPVRRHDLFLNRATTLMNGPQAWALAGGQSSAGAGIKIGILDTGVDQTHPALQDSSLPMPAGFPLCSGFTGSGTAAGCAAFTNSKVIVARSYIGALAAGSDPKNPAVDSRPDDVTPRDHVGHGTATASTAAGNTATGSVTINGMAPKAYIGNYRVFGSPTVNDGTYGDVEVMALNDAINDGMDVISFSGGGPAFTGPLDTGAACGQPAGVYCDVAAAAFEAAAQKGATIVVAAGNENGAALSSTTYPFYPLYNSIASPGNAPDVITVGATTNSHGFVPLVEVTDSSAPASLKTITAAMASTYASGGAVSGTIVDVTALGDNGLACAALPSGSLNNAIALIQRGTCNFSVKMTNAVTAGAAGVVFYMATTGTLIQPAGLDYFSQTAAIISLSDGTALKSYVDAHPGAQLTIDPSAVEQSGFAANQVAGFSSFGPSLGLNGMKPDLLAVGESLYMPAQNYDPLGGLFSSNRYIFAAGTSFSTPLVAGAAALVKQKHSGYTGLQIKSALVGTTTQNVKTDDQGSASVNVLQTGAGQLTADAAIRTNVLASPANVSFGSFAAAAALSGSRQITFTNTGAAPVTVALSISGTGVQPAISPATLTLAAAGTPGSSATATLTLAGTAPAAGIYNGNLLATGGAVPVNVAWMYLVSVGAISPNSNLNILSGDYNDGTVSQVIPDGQAAFQAIDDFGVPLAGQPVSWSADSGVTLSQTSSVTDQFGVAYATVTMGPVAGTYSVYACVGVTTCTSAFVNNSQGLGYAFTEFSRDVPTITAAGVVNAASYKQPIAPGSFIAIFGTGLYDSSVTATGNPTDTATGNRLPLALDYTRVTFDVPSAGISVPGRVYYAGTVAGQGYQLVTAQVPWELQGQSSVQVKVAINYTNGNVVTVPLSNYSPAFFPGGAFVAASNNSGAIGASNPAVRGSVIVLYANGLGPVTNQPASGDPANPTPATLQDLSATTTPATVTIGGQAANVLFAGLAPGEIGVYQVNVTVPSGIAAGNQPVVLSIGGASTPAGTLPIQ